MGADADLIRYIHVRYVGRSASAHNYMILSQYELVDLFRLSIPEMNSRVPHSPGFKA